MYHYAISICPDGEATCRDIPEFVGFGNDVEEILEDAQDMLLTILAIYQSQGSGIPAATAPLKGEMKVALSALTEAKITLWNTFLDSGYTLFEAADCTGFQPQQLNNMLNLFSESELETITCATWALARRKCPVALHA